MECRSWGVRNHDYATLAEMLGDSDEGWRQKSDPDGGH